MEQQPVAVSAAGTLQRYHIQRVPHCSPLPSLPAQLSLFLSLCCCSLSFSNMFLHLLAYMHFIPLLFTYPSVIKTIPILISLNTLQRTHRPEALRAEKGLKRNFNAPNGSHFMEGECFGGIEIVCNMK